MTYVVALIRLRDRLEHLGGPERQRLALERELEASLLADDPDAAARRVRSTCLDLGCDPVEACTHLLLAEARCRD